MPMASSFDLLFEKFRQRPPRPVKGSIEALTTSKNSASRFDDTTKHGLDEGALMVSGKLIAVLRPENSRGRRSINHVGNWNSARLRTHQ